MSISYVDKKEDANMIIAVMDGNSYEYSLGYRVWWTRDKEIYKSTIAIDRKTSFNLEEQKSSISYGIMSSLGNFLFKSNPDKIQSVLYDIFDGITDFDLKILEVQYNSKIKAGMYENEVRKVLKTMRK